MEIQVAENKKEQVWIQNKARAKGEREDQREEDTYRTSTQEAGKSSQSHSKAEANLGYENLSETENKQASIIRTVWRRYQNE